MKYLLILLLGSSISYADKKEAATSGKRDVAQAAGPCYKSRADKNLIVCFDQDYTNVQNGSGSSSLMGRGTATKFTWVRTTKNMLLIEKEGVTDKDSDCESGLVIKGKVMTVTNLDENEDCGILSGKYILQARRH